jgi:hypothetical protein
MAQVWSKLVVVALVAATPSALGAAETSQGVTLQLTVPVTCMVKHSPGMIPSGNGYVLGELHEYCNAPTGYKVVARYTPGHLRGTTISLGGDRAVLDGSGETVVSRSTSPHIRDRQIVANPGPSGFDADSLDFDIIAG